MSWHHRLLFAPMALIAGTAVSAAGTLDRDMRSLGGYPLCEASAAIVVECPSPLEEGECLLVGDNEIRDRLFLFRITEEDGLVHLEERRELPFEGFKPLKNEDTFTISDIEALVPLDDEIVVFGSHSRNSKCKARKKRRIFFHGQVGSTAITPGSADPVISAEHECSLLFGDNRDAETQRVCEVIEKSEEKADAANKLASKKREDACSEKPALNIEAAVFVADGGGSGHIWVGLRAPLLDDGKAILLRQKAGQEHLSFDAVAFLDLNELGVREMSAHDGRIWGISGTAADSRNNHVLWRFDAGELVHGATIKPEEISELPTSSEGLALSSKHVWVAIDGAEPEKQNRISCLTDSRYTVQSIPD